MKPLSGKRAFYAMGQRARRHFTYRPANAQWPDWARKAYEQGYEDERWSSARQTVKTWPVSKLAESIQ
jgi:hypothetical protein